MDRAKWVLVALLAVGVFSGCLVGTVFAFLDSVVSEAAVWLFYVSVSLSIGILAAGIGYLYYKFRFYQPRV